MMEKVGRYQNESDLFSYTVNVNISFHHLSVEDQLHAFVEVQSPKTMSVGFGGA